MPARRGGRSGFGSRSRGFGSRGRFGSRSRGGRAQPSPFQVALLQRPQTTNSRIVFPWLMGEYSKSEFNPVVTQGRASEGDIDRVIQAVKGVEHYNPNISGWWMCLLPLIMCGGMAIIMIIFFTSLNKSIENSRTSGGSSSSFNFLIMPIGMFGLFCIMCCLMICLQKVQNERFVKREQEIKGVLDQFNANEFDMKGINWKCGKFGAWILMDLNFVLQQPGMANMNMMGGGFMVNNGMGMGGNFANVGVGMPVEGNGNFFAPAV